jgi:aspartyl-tRNA(Asn)/glutamyl-tRNA(Gln) amidotransferase subunit A
VKPLWERPAAELGAGVRSGEFSAADVTAAALARLRAVEPLLGAFLHVLDAEAMRRAEAIDRRRRGGQALGPLAGVPVALKDNLHLAGHPVSCASRVLEGYVAPYTATAVARLLEADAVVIGKTNLDEFAMGSSCENSAFGPTRNPWNLDMVPGGSSGGSAAAVAAGCVPLALGSDTGGSIRQPAALSGVVGLKPTYGRVSRYGLVAFASSLDQIGPLTRRVSDAALALDVIAGHDPRDATSAAEPVPGFVAGLGSGIAGLRIGVLREVDAGSLAPDSAAVWRRALATLESLGAVVSEVSMPYLPAAIAVYYVVANSEASANLARFDGVRYGRRATPAAASDGLLGTYVESRSQGFGAEVKRRIMLGTFALAAGYYEAYYGRARGVQRALRDQFARVLETVDILVTPTSPTGAFALGEKLDDPLTMYLNDIFTVPANLLGAPALAVPSGFDERGLPLSIQFLGRPFDEATLLRAGHAFEAASPVPTLAPLAAPA